MRLWQLALYDQRRREALRAAEAIGVVPVSMKLGQVKLKLAGLQAVDRGPRPRMRRLDRQSSVRMCRRLTRTSGSYKYQLQG